jgi:acetyl-CoA synthetase
MTGAYLTTKWVFDLKDEDTFWCSADIGWVTGHSYVVYGPLLNGATTLMYEGAPNYPEPDRFWSIIEKYRVNIFYTAPTAIRAFIKWGDTWPARHDLTSLRLLGTVGEPINPEAGLVSQTHRPRSLSDRRYVVADRDGAIMISPVPGAIARNPDQRLDPYRESSRCRRSAGKSVGQIREVSVIKRPGHRCCERFTAIRTLQEAILERDSRHVLYG